MSNKNSEQFAKRDENYHLSEAYARRAEEIKAKKEPKVKEDKKDK